MYSRQGAGGGNDISQQRQPENGFLTVSSFILPEVSLSSQMLLSRSEETATI